MGMVGYFSKAIFSKWLFLLIKRSTMHMIHSRSWWPKPSTLKPMFHLSMLLYYFTVESVCQFPLGPLSLEPRKMPSTQDALNKFEINNWINEEVPMAHSLCSPWRMTNYQSQCCTHAPDRGLFPHRIVLTISSETDHSTKTVTHVHIIRQEREVQLQHTHPSTLHSVLPAFRLSVSASSLSLTSTNSLIGKAPNLLSVLPE